MLPSIVSAVCLGADVSVPAGSASCCFASPKSSSLTPVAVSMTLLGFRSRCTMPCRCAVSRASAISSAMGRASATGTGPRSISPDRTVPQSGQRRMAPGLGARSPSSRWYDDSVFEMLDKGRNRELFGLAPRGPWT